MPFVRFSRDKRGYEHIYLVQVDHGRSGATPPRILYWYRTPPGVKVGREPFDAAARRALEAEYPNLEFDWQRIANTSMPPPETENWREKRRAERALKQARAAEERIEPESADAGTMADAGEEMRAESPAPGPEPAPATTEADERRRRRRRGGRRRRKPGAAPTTTGEAGAAPADAAGSTLDSQEQE